MIVWPTWRCELWALGAHQSGLIFGTGRLQWVVLHGWSGCRKRQHWNNVFHTAAINPTSNSISSHHLSRPLLQQPQKKMALYLNGMLLYDLFWGCFLQQMCRKEAALNRFISENHRNCDLDHTQVQPHQQRASLGPVAINAGNRPDPVGKSEQEEWCWNQWSMIKSPIRCFVFHSQHINIVLSLESGSVFFFLWIIQERNRCRNVLKGKLILVGFKMFQAITCYASTCNIAARLTSKNTQWIQHTWSSYILGTRQLFTLKLLDYHHPLENWAIVPPTKKKWNSSRFRWSYLVTTIVILSVCNYSL